MTSVNTNIKQYLEAMMETVSSFQNQSNFTFTRNCGNIKKMQMLATYFSNVTKDILQAKYMLT